MKNKKCATQEPCVLNFPAYNARCLLDFGCNTRFEYKEEDDNKVTLIRKNMEFTIPQESFDKLFKIIE